MSSTLQDRHYPKIGMGLKNSGRPPAGSRIFVIRISGIFLMAFFICVAPVWGLSGETGQFAISCNVDNAEVYFDDTFQGFISGGQLTVSVPTRGYDMRYTSVEVRKTGYVTFSGNLKPYPETGQVVPVNVTLVQMSGTRPETTGPAPLSLTIVPVVAGLFCARAVIGLKKHLG